MKLADSGSATEAKASGKTKNLTISKTQMMLRNIDA
jgi:hypothetical protein